MVLYSTRTKGKYSFPYKFKNIIKQYNIEDYNMQYAVRCMPGYNPITFSL